MEITIFKHFTQVMGYRTLSEVLGAIQQGVYKDQVLAVRRAIELGDKKLADEIKKQLHAFTICGKFVGGRTMEFLQVYHPFVILDIDKLDQVNLERVIKAVRGLPYTRAAFISPSGNGCKIIFEVNSHQEQHLLAFKQVSEFYEKKLRIKIDPSGKDITRLCFFSYDEELFFNKESEVFEVKESVVKPLPFLEKNKRGLPQSNLTTQRDDRNDIEACLQFTKQKLTYQNGNRNNFVYLFASNCNREGINEQEVLSFAKREFDLEEKEIKKTVTSAYLHHRTEFNRGHFSKKKNEIDGFSLVDEMLETPCFPVEIFPNLPNLLRRGCGLPPNKLDTG